MVTFIESMYLDTASVYFCIKIEIKVKSSQLISTMFLELFIVSSFVAILSSASVASRDGIFVRDGRIIGGFNAGPSQFPYQVSLRTPLLQHFCGASIVSSSWVLTGM